MKRAFAWSVIVLLVLCCIGLFTLSAAIESLPLCISREKNTGPERMLERAGWDCRPKAVDESAREAPRQGGESVENGGS